MHLPVEDAESVTEAIEMFGSSVMFLIDETDLATYRESIEGLRMLMGVKAEAEKATGGFVDLPKVLKLLKEYPVEESDADPATETAA